MFNIVYIVFVRRGPRKLEEAVSNPLLIFNDSKYVLKRNLCISRHN